MKKQNSNLLMLLLLLFTVVTFFPYNAFAGAKIDQGDSIVFDLTKTLIKNGIIEVPVYISSDNEINALDFSIQFNEVKLKFDKVIDNTKYIEDLAFYSPSTKFLKFTSNSFSNYEKRKTILTIRFISDSLTVNKSDFFNLSGYLNGEVCNIMFIDSLDKSKVPNNIRQFNNFKEHLSCGSEHTLALKTNGQVWAWGNNASGQLGDNSVNSAKSPVQVRGLLNNGLLNNAIAVASGGRHSLALLCDGSLLAWGANDAGQLGNGNNDSSLFPVLVKGLPNDIPVFSIAAGDMHSIAILVDGSIWAWGDNSFGQLGNTTIDNSSTPVKVSGIDGAGFLDKAYKVAAGSFHNLVLLSNGDIVSFGNNEEGQLGNGNTGGILLSPTRVLITDKLDSLKKVIDVDAGKNHSLALLSDGSLLAWGDNSKGQLGDSSFVDASEPVYVKGISNVKQIASGDDFNIAVLKDSTAWAWGDNANGQLGNNASGNAHAMPVQMFGIGNFDFFSDPFIVAAGKSFSAAILNKSTGGFYCAAGENSFGQLGDSTLISKSYFVKVSKSFTMDLPINGFTPENGKIICSASNITFSPIAPSITGNSYFWNFGIGAIPQTSNSPDPVSVKFLTPGSKTVSLIISKNGFCNETWYDTLTQIINVIPGANATFTSSSPGCQGQGINFYNAGSSGSGVTHLWNLGFNSLTATDENLTEIRFPESGAFVVTHTVVIAECALNDSKTQVVTIHPTPEVVIETTGKACINDSISYSSAGSSGPGTSYIWEFGSGASLSTSNVQNPQQIYYKSAGYKNVNLFVKNQFGCFNSIEKTIEIKPTPAADFESSAFVSLCSSESIDFLHTGDTTNLSYFWSFGDDANVDSSRLRNPIGISYLKSGIKVVKLVTTNDSSKCSVSSTKIFTVNPSPISNFNIPESACADKNLVFTNASSQDDQATYSWDFGLGAIPPSSTSKIPEMVRYVSAGNKVIKLIVRNSLGCSSTLTQNYLVKALPNKANAGEDRLVCKGDAVKIGDELIDGKTYKWIPSFGLDNPNIANPSARPDSTITYFLTVSDSFCESEIDSVEVFVNELPKASAGINDSVIKGESIELQATGGVFYKWWPGMDLSNISASNPLAKPDQTSTYYVLVTDDNGCKDTASVIVYVKMPNEDKLPNTFAPGGFGNDKFYINIESAEKFEFVVFNNWGKSVFYTKDINLGWDGKNQVTGEDMPQGAYVYFVNAITKDGTPINRQGLINLIR